METRSTTSKLTNGPGESNAVCPGAGDRVFFVGVTADGRTQIYKVSASGGQAELVGNWVVLPYTVPAPSVDRRHMAFLVLRKDGTIGVQAISLETGVSEGELKAPTTVSPNQFSFCWTTDGRAVVLADNRSGAENLWAFPILAGGEPKQLTFYDSGSIWGFQLSPEGKSIAIVRNSQFSDAVLLEEAKQK